MRYRPNRCKEGVPIGLLIAMVLPNKDSALGQVRIQAITVTDVGHFFIKRVLAPNE